MGPSGYSRLRRLSARFMYISLANSLDHCTQGATGDGGDMACVTGEDMDYAEGLEEWPEGVWLKVKEVIDVSVHIHGTDVG